jgi:FAD/FMN-containing dehydrogenase
MSMFDPSLTPDLESPQPIDGTLAPEGADALEALPALPAAPAFEDLRVRLAGRLALPGDATWDADRLAWNLAADQHPSAVVFAESTEDVVATVEFARERGLHVAAQGTGHGAGPLAAAGMADTVLIKTERMRDVTIDPEVRRARVGAGVTWAEVAAIADQHGLTALAGSSPDVGVVGYSLGGGMGWLARLHGSAADSVTAIELVTADGRVVRTDRHNEPDLFWAMRGGGGSFGVVTALEFALYPHASVVTAALMWPLERAPEVLPAWRDWAATMPDTVTSLGRVVRLPPLPMLPEMLRGRSLVVVEAALAVSEAEAHGLLAPLLALGPEIPMIQVVPPSGLAALHMDPPEPVAGIGDGLVLSDLPAEAIAALLEVAGAGRESALLSIEVRQLGGALERRDGERSAFRLGGAFGTYMVGIAMSPEMAAAAERSIDVVAAALEPWRAPHSYFNFSERPVDAASLYTPEDLERLRRVRQAWDPSGMFRSNHPIE